VLDLAYQMWQKQRAMKMPQLALYRDPFAMSLRESGKTNWRDVIDHQPVVVETANDALLAATSGYRSLQVCLEYAKALPYAKITPQSIGSGVAGGQFDGRHFVKVLEACLEFSKLNERNIRNWAQLVEQNKKAFSEAYDPSVIDGQVRTLGLIQARIDKAFQRLYALKEYRRLEESRKPAAIPSPSITPTAELPKDEVSVEVQVDEDDEPSR
jgi:hypothetical protein